MKTEDINQAKSTQESGKKDPKIKKVINSADKKTFIKNLGMFAAAFAGSATAEVAFSVDDNDHEVAKEEVSEVEEVLDDHTEEAVVAEAVEEEAESTHQTHPSEDEKNDVEPYPAPSDEPVVVVQIDPRDYNEENVFDFKEVGYIYDELGNMYPVASANLNGMDVLLVDVSDDMEFDFVLFPTGEYLECPGNLTFDDVQLALAQSQDTSDLAYIEPDDDDNYSFTFDDHDSSDYNEDPLA